MKKYFAAALVALTALFSTDMVEAKSRGFSSSRSFGFSSSRSSSYKSSGFSGFSSSKSSKPSTVSPKTNNSGFSSSKVAPSTGTVQVPKTNSSGFSSSKVAPSVVAPQAPKAKTTFDLLKARNSIVPPKPKDVYVREFKAQNAAKYPTTFNTQPATRPSYIPKSTVVDGKSREITYDPFTRSYGFMNDLGKFMIYDAITDLALDAFKKDETVYIQQTQQLDKDINAAKQEAVRKDSEQKNKEFLHNIGIAFLGLLGIAGAGLALFLAIKPLTKL